MGNREELTQMGVKILSAVRNELYLNMHFMGPAIYSLTPEMDLWTKTIGTDAVSVRFNPNYLGQTYLEHPYLLDRAYMHILMHSLFRHMFQIRRYRDRELWDICSDIAAESVIDGMDYEIINVVLSDYREEVYRRLHADVGVLTAEKLYRYFSEHEIDFETRVRLSAEFARDDHSFWDRMQENNREDSGENTPPPLLTESAYRKADEKWKNNSKQIEAALSFSGKRASKDEGGLERVLAITNRHRTDFRDFLKRFAVVREEARSDPDSFDYGFYNYGMEMYGNMPLIEENEYRETSGIEELVIVIDTSASCQRVLVQRFLNETAGILENSESFFRKIRVHILECDDRVRRDTVIRKPGDIRKYADGFAVSGGGGTDFRPAFAYVDDLIIRGKLQELKGLMYFTDGFGIYPEQAPHYETAFVFCRDDDINDREVPDWAIKLYLDKEEK